MRMLAQTKILVLSASNPKWAPNRHGGTPSDRNIGAENPHGKNNIVFFDGHVEACTLVEIPQNPDSLQGRRFWVPERESGE